MDMIGMQPLLAHHSMDVKRIYEESITTRHAISSNLAVDAELD